MNRSDDGPNGADVDVPYSSPSTKIICLSSAQLEAARQELWREPPRLQEWNAIQIWYNTVLQFSVRSLTFDRDSLPAISGVAKEVQRHTGFDYHAGLWWQDMHNGLVWTVGVRCIRPRILLHHGLGLLFVGAKPFDRLVSDQREDYTKSSLLLPLLLRF